MSREGLVFLRGFGGRFVAPASSPLLSSFHPFLAGAPERLENIALHPQQPGFDRRCPAESPEERDEPRRVHSRLGPISNATSANVRNGSWPCKNVLAEARGPTDAGRGSGPQPGLAAQNSDYCRFTSGHLLSTSGWAASSAGIWRRTL
jgi:hypothetical protein